MNNDYDRPSWTLRYKSKPMSANQQRKKHYMQEAAFVKEWRQAFWALSREAEIPVCERVLVDAYQIVSKASEAYDPLSIAPSVKAAIDGALVDAGVIPDDTGDYVACVSCFPAKVEPEYGAGLEIEIFDLSCHNPQV